MREEKKKKCNSIETLNYLNGLANRHVVDNRRPGIAHSFLRLANNISPGPSTFFLKYIGIVFIRDLMMVMTSIMSKALVAATFVYPLLVNGIPAPQPVAPGIPSAATAQNELEDLVVAAQGPQTGYSRDKFPHWISQGR